MANDPDPTASASGRSVRAHLRRAFLTGTALTIPLVLTLVVFQLALDLVAHVVSPIVSGVELVYGEDEPPQVVLEVVTALTLAATVLLIGFLAEHRTGTSRLASGFDALMARIPGLGSVYSGTRRLSEVLLEGDTQSFQEVKLVEFPREGAYMVGFLTAEPPDTVLEAAGATEMQTLFVPLAPNPVMGGFLAHLPAERVHDVDLTVEEGVQSIVTSGAAIDPRVDDVDTDVVGVGGLGDAQLLESDILDREVLKPDVFEDDDDGPGEPSRGELGDDVCDRDGRERSG